ncbi:MAG: ATP-binding cassette domain-containing protein, partial [Chloroflexi bacterium]|nr:ATP-binding cassette domain-containing protein [Chloroflexota bacterium]
PAAPMADVVRAAQHAHADDFIRALPDGYGTLIGERGARLSGGQAQRIALARAFLKDAPLLVLDEATANLDPATETLVQDAIRALLYDRSALVIAHRLRTVTDADQIVVLESGRVVESGTHHDLVQAAGIYQKLVTFSQV